MMLYCTAQVPHYSNGSDPMEDPMCDAIRDPISRDLISLYLAFNPKLVATLWPTYHSITHVPMNMAEKDPTADPTSDDRT